MNRARTADASVSRPAHERHGYVDRSATQLGRKRRLQMYMVQTESSIICQRNHLNVNRQKCQVVSEWGQWMISHCSRINVTNMIRDPDNHFPYCGIILTIVFAIAVLVGPCLMPVSMILLFL